MNQIIVINNQEVPFDVKEDGTVFADSLHLAKVFGKKHKNVIQSIENLPRDDFTGLNFQPSEYIDGSGKRNKMYQMTRDGFTMIVMGMTGKKAYEWKKQYIEAFNRLERHYFDADAPRLPEHAAAPHTLMLKKQPTGTYALGELELIKDLDLAMMMGYVRTRSIRRLIRNLVKNGIISRPLTNAEHYAHAYYLSAEQARAVVYHSLLRDKDAVFEHLDNIFAMARPQEITLLDFMEEA